MYSNSNLIFLIYFIVTRFGMFIWIYSMSPRQLVTEVFFVLMQKTYFMLTMTKINFDGNCMVSTTTQKFCSLLHQTAKALSKLRIANSANKFSTNWLLRLVLKCLSELSFPTDNHPLGPRVHGEAPIAWAPVINLPIKYNRMMLQDVVNESGLEQLVLYRAEDSNK